MIPFKRIMCPIDFSDHSLKALDVAAEMARHFGADLTVIHVVTPVPMSYIPPPPVSPISAPPASFNVEEYERELMSNSLTKLKDVVTQRVHEQIPVVPVVVMGKTAYEIVEIAQDQGADLIVIATHGHSGWKRFLFGSVVEKVVRMSPIPVLIVHPSQEKTSSKAKSKISKEK